MVVPVSSRALIWYVGLPMHRGYGSFAVVVVVVAIVVVVVVDCSHRGLV